MNAALVYVDIDHPGHSFRGNNEVAQNQNQNEKPNFMRFHIPKKLANFEVFHNNISSSINLLLFLKSDHSFDFKMSPTEDGNIKVINFKRI